MIMDSVLAMGIQIVGAFIAAYSQLLLKNSALIEYKNSWQNYINIRVLSSYVLLFLTTVISMFALRFLSYKLVAILGTSSYVFVVFLSKFILKEKISKKKFIGVLVIVVGIIIFGLE